MVGSGSDGGGSVEVGDDDDDDEEVESWFPTGMPATVRDMAGSRTT